MLHTKKSQSILQLYNSLTTKGDVNSLEHFTDGSHFYEIVAILQPFLIQGKGEGNLSTESIIFSETSIACNEEVITSIEEEATEEKMETPVSESANAVSFVIKESDHTDTQKKYEVIKKFIDDFYHIDSCSLIDYGECQKGKELELAKVAVFLLTALVQHKLSTGDDLEILCLLEPEVQENIRECLGLVLDEKDTRGSQIKKSDLHKVLGHAATCKGTPVRKQPPRSSLDSNDLSEGVKNVPKKRKERVYEDLQDSPLKILLESPKIQYRAAISRKESELLKLRSALHDEENKFMDLTSDKENLNNELGKIKKELEFYKKELQSLREALSEKEELENARAEELKAKMIEAEKDRKLIESQRDEIKQLKEHYEALQEKQLEKEKKLEQDAITPLISENNRLKDKIQILELDNEGKAETNKALQERILSCENDLNKYKQMVQEYSASNRKELIAGSPDTYSCKIVYLPEGIMDQDGASNRISSKGNNSNVGSVQVKEEHSQNNVHRPKEENTRLRRNPPRNESKFVSTSESSITTSSNSFKKESDTAATDNVSESSFSTKSDSKMNGQLRASVDDPGLPENFTNGRINYERFTLSCFLLELIHRENFPSPVKDKLKEICPKSDDPDLVVSFLRSLLVAYKQAVPSVTTRSSHSAATASEGKNAAKASEGKNASKASERKNASKASEGKSASKEQLEDRIKHLEGVCDRLAADARRMREIAEEKGRKIDDILNPTIQDLENSNTVLKEKLALVQEKSFNLEKLVKKKENDIRKYTFIIQEIEKKRAKDPKEDREKLQRRVKQLNKECLDFLEETGNLKRTIKNLEGMMEHLQFEIKVLKEQKRELEEKLFLEQSGKSENTTDRDALVLHYLKKSKLGYRNKDIELENEEQRSSRPIVKVDAYILNSENEPSTSNSMLAGGSIRNSYFQVADEDDFLNESSLAEIHNGGVPEGESAENRLLELQRRNTLCPPHLQSSYPLEIQNMTPSERKYYNPEASSSSSFAQGRKTSLHNEKRDIHKKPQSKYIESDSDEEDVSYSFSVKKRKVSEMDRISVPVSKKHYKPANSVAMEHSKDQENPRKPSTPLKRVAAFVRRRSTTFKTPSSVNRLMRLQRKSKIH